MRNIVDELRPENLRTVDGVCTPTVEIHIAVLERAIATIERLRSLAGKAGVGPSFSDMTSELRHQTPTDA